MQQRQPRDKPFPRKRLSDNHLPLLVHAMHLHDILGKIHADPRNRVHHFLRWRNLIEVGYVATWLCRPIGAKSLLIHRSRRAQAFRTKKPLSAAVRINRSGRQTRHLLFQVRHQYRGSTPEPQKFPSSHIVNINRLISANERMLTCRSASDERSGLARSDSFLRFLSGTSGAIMLPI
jgi:hypothetical protein